MPKSVFVDPLATRAKGEITFESIPVNAYDKSVAEERGKYGDQNLMRIYRDITILREFESMLNQIKTQGVYQGIETTYPGPAHLSLGQEAADQLRVGARGVILSKEHFMKTQRK